MPYLDVSSVLSDPMIADRVKVTRQKEVVGTNGRVSIVPEVFPIVVGVMTSAGPNDLERVPEAQRMGRVMSFVTKFRLRGPSPGYQPDTIDWAGDTYLVVTVDPYPRYGAGFVQSIIASTDIIDKPTPEHNSNDQ